MRQPRGRGEQASAAALFRIPLEKVLLGVETGDAMMIEKLQQDCGWHGLPILLLTMQWTQAASAARLAIPVCEQPTSADTAARNIRAGRW
jgi:hypothetical protein